MMRHLWKRVLLVAALVALAALSPSTRTAHAANSIITVDAGADAGKYTSLALPASGYPVVSYYDATNGDLKVLRCGNATCTLGNIIATVGSADHDVGSYSSLVLDGLGRPVVSYYDATSGDLKVMHCVTANCLGDGGYSVDTAGDVGRYTSLALDGLGRPVVSYYDATNGDLKVLHCDDPYCEGDESGNIRSPDRGGPSDHDVGQYSALALEGGVNPVVSYYDFTNGDLKVLHCNDPNCDPSVNGAETVHQPDRPPEDDSGLYTSLALDTNGFPVVSYFDATSHRVKVLHCNDIECSSAVNGQESVTSPAPDVASDVFISLALDGGGNPVVSYWDTDLKVLHCDDPNCAGDELSHISSPDPGINVGWYTSLALDGSSNPVVSYYRSNGGVLKVLRCGNAGCTSGNTIASPDGGLDVGAHTSLALGAGGMPVVSYYRSSGGGLKVLRCNDVNCTSKSINFPYRGGDAGTYSSLALDTSGYPVVSYYDFTNGDLKVLHCNDVACDPGVNGQESITTPDSGGRVGMYTSLALDINNRPVVSYLDVTNQSLKVLHCGDPDCFFSGTNWITTVDAGGQVGHFNSLALDSLGKPVVSYHDYANRNLKVLHCGNANCTSGNIIKTPDSSGDVGGHTSLALDSLGRPVISYYDEGQEPTLKVMHCNDPNCDPSVNGAESIRRPLMPDQDDQGFYSSLALDSNGYPVVSFYDATTTALNVLHCNDPNCDSAVNGAESVTSPDTLNEVGKYSSLALDISGYPVVSYYDDTGGDLKVLHCGTLTCGAVAPGDSDGDGCADTEEAAGAPSPKPGSTGAYDPLDPYDFYDVPVPVRPDPQANGTKNKAVNFQDVLAVLAYVGTYEGGPANLNGVDYDSPKMGAGTKAGRDYDRSPSPPPNPPNDAGPPSGAVNFQDVLAVLGQIGLACTGVP